ncbi:MAG TPA: 30S ribosomal protein S9 [Patescibacteria group bacterium]
MATNQKKNYSYAVGRRRESSARVRVFRGSGDNMVNGMVIGKYFEGDVARHYWNKPFEILEVEGKYYATAKVVGGGKNGQLDAFVLGLSRALSKIKPDKYRTPLKKAGLLSSDPRIRERRKVGTGGRARRKKQSPKR